MIPLDPSEELRLSILKKYWGHQSFRPDQENIIESVVQGRDTVALLPTGGGKSICFQIPAMMLPGVCIVVSPLIALMRDQVDQLKKRGIKAHAINATLSKREIDIALDNAVYGDVKFLYLSPERLQSDIVKVRLQKMKICLLAIDEAHCISEWGHDFRPAYRQINELRELLPQVPVIALTATATQKVLADLVEQLALRQPNIFAKSFHRENLIFVYQNESFKLNRILSIARKMKGSGIIYVGTRRETVRYAQLLRANKLAAVAYHGGMEYKERVEAQDLWINNKAQIVVATNAFGMGIDKSNVRFVIHLQLPVSPEAYFQEAGRAGRDGKLAYAVALIQDGDMDTLRERVMAGIPEEEDVLQTYRALANAYQVAAGLTDGKAYPIDIAAFSKKWGLKPSKTAGALRFLEWSEMITLSEAVLSPSKVYSAMSAKDLYSFIIGNERFEKLLQFMMRSYEGIFDYPVAISENNIGVKLRISSDDVRKQIEELAEMNVLRYDMQSELPLLQFSGHRPKAESLSIDRPRLASQKNRILDGLVFMEQYAKNTGRCRSAFLLKYFGENQTMPCGKCDVCLTKVVMEPKSETFRKLVTALSGDLPETEKTETLGQFHPKEIDFVKRWLQENNDTPSVN